MHWPSWPGQHLPGRIFSLGQYLKELIIGQEEEPGEEEALLFQVLIQSFKNELQEFVGLFQPLQHPLDSHNHQDMFILKRRGKQGWSRFHFCGCEGHCDQRGGGTGVRGKDVAHLILSGCSLSWRATKGGTRNETWKQELKLRP